MSAGKEENIEAEFAQAQEKIRLLNGALKNRDDLVATLDTTIKALHDQSLEKSKVLQTFLTFHIQLERFFSFLEWQQAHTNFDFENCAALVRVLRFMMANCKAQYDLLGADEKKALLFFLDAPAHGQLNSMK